VIVPVLKSDTKQRLVETENPISCAAVNWKVYTRISVIALYGLQLRDCTKKGQ
jgi:hypothetical protein